MARPVFSLWWSGVAAGMSISFSLLAQAILHTHLPDTPWRPLVADFGYTVGFVMVIMSRQQLFTENTITAVLPVIATFNYTNLTKMARMWAVVLLANFAGTLFAALFSTFTPVISPELLNGMVDISGQILGHSWLEMFFKGIAAGFLIAALVWLIPGCRERAVLRHRADDLPDFCRQFHAHCRRKRRSFSASTQWRASVADNVDRILVAGACRQHRRRHRAVHAHRLRASCEGNLSRSGRSVRQNSHRHTFRRWDLASFRMVRDGNEWIAFRIVSPETSFRDVVGVHDQAVDLAVDAIFC